MNKMQRGGYGPVEWGKQGAKEFKRTEAKRARAARAAGPPATASRGIQNPAAAKAAKKAVKAGMKARRKNSRNIQRRMVKIK